MGNKRVEFVGHLRTGKMPLSIIASTTDDSRDKQWFLQCPWFRWKVPLSQAAPWVLKTHKSKGENVAAGTSEIRSQWWVSPACKFILSNKYSKFMMTCRTLWTFKQRPLLFFNQTLMKKKIKESLKRGPSPLFFKWGNKFKVAFSWRIYALPILRQWVLCGVHSTPVQGF